MFRVTTCPFLLLAVICDLFLLITVYGIVLKFDLVYFDAVLELVHNHPLECSVSSRDVEYLHTPYCIFAFVSRSLVLICVYSQRYVSAVLVIFL